MNEYEQAIEDDIFIAEEARRAGDRRRRTDSEDGFFAIEENDVDI